MTVRDCSGVCGQTLGHSHVTVLCGVPCKGTPTQTVAECPADQHSGRARPYSRSECRDAARPCPFVSCGWHALWVRPRRERAGLDDDGLAELALGLPVTCCLDLVEQGGATLREVGEAIGATRERARQIEAGALVRLRRPVTAAVARDAGDVGAEWETAPEDAWNETTGWA